MICNPFSVFATKIATGIGLFFMADKPIYEYRMCEIRDRGGDLSKRWYVEFWVWDVATEKLIRKLDYLSAKFKTAPERYAEAQRIKTEIDKALKDGAYIDSSGKTQRQKHDPRPKSILKAFQWFTKEHSGEVGDRAVDGYNSFLNVFEEYLADRKLTDLPLTRFDQDQVFAFLSYLTNERPVKKGKTVIRVGVSNRTRNNYKIWLDTVFNYLVKRKVLDENPAKEVSKLRVSNSSHIPYSDVQAKRVKDHLREKDPQMLLFCAFIYYTLARPKEIQLLKVRDIRGNKLLISAQVEVKGEKKQLSKNHKNQFVIIPDGLRQLIREFGVLDHNNDFFIFGNKGEPGPEPYSKHYSTKRYKPHLDFLGITGGQTLYSWKHTGAIKLYQATKDMKKVQRQCRHWSITETDNYLRDLGMFEDDEVEFNFPAF
ncbi:site-specific integrase [Algoriphagus halophytocola]|uniref:tyrosine-type recombinase/integrase n=1 Tax=Algoriphagus halophytocola TaxID=2991499 RepID=UPI0022DDA623|nr:site-specific integrase [Algoriphagus sp. TR-M9]WBL42411.1 site-specific integrase [Algoriphagus sp. TR-M9]WBL43078.1 site-specific integrase [Algoriphagus sp. TR-M9]